MTGYFRVRMAILLLIAAAVLAVFSMITGPMRDRYRDALTDSRELSALKQRLTSQLSALAEGDVTVGLVDGIAWRGAERTEIEVRVQDKVLAIAEANALQLTSYGPAPAPASVKLPALGYQIEATVNWENLLRFMSDVGRVAPALAISEFSVRGAPPVLNQGEPKLYLRMVIWGLAPETGAAP